MHLSLLGFLQIKERREEIDSLLFFSLSCVTHKDHKLSANLSSNRRHTQQEREKTKGQGRWVGWESETQREGRKKERKNTYWQNFSLPLDNKKSPTKNILLLSCNLVLSFKARDDESMTENDKGKRGMRRVAWNEKERKRRDKEWQTGRFIVFMRFLTSSYCSNIGYVSDSLESEKLRKDIDYRRLRTYRLREAISNEIGENLITRKVTKSI